MSNFDRLNADGRPSRAELSADAHEEARESARLALNENIPALVLDQAAEGKPHAEEQIVDVIVTAYLEALNAH